MKHKLTLSVDPTKWYLFRKQNPEFNMSDFVDNFLNQKLKENITIEWSK